MQTRTHLTTPPGSTPTGIGGAREQAELYTPGLAIPTERRFPGRHQGKLITAGLIVLLVVFAWIAFKLATSGQDFDPALDPAGPGAPVEEFDPSIEAPPANG